MRVNQSTSRTVESLRIDPLSNNSSNAIHVATSSTDKSHHPAQDTVDFTSKQTIASLAQAATGQSDARAAKVQALKQAVEQGQYQLDSAKIAAALVNADV
jgi:flagellar biosynthesis anti-sigma factor FlgM